MANRLSHELRTPIAVVRSSLENLRMEVGDASAQTYLDRADAGLSRLSRILTRMSEATRMEQALASAELERFDLAAVVAECINGYRVAYPARDFESRLPPYPVYVRGVPDLAAQMPSPPRCSTSWSRTPPISRPRARPSVSTSASRPRPRRCRSATPARYCRPNSKGACSNRW